MIGSFMYACAIAVVVACTSWNGNWVQQPSGAFVYKVCRQSVLLVRPN